MKNHERLVRDLTDRTYDATKADLQLLLRIDRDRTLALLSECLTMDDIDQLQGMLP